MAFHKSTLYHPAEQKASIYAKAFGHPERLEILIFLSKLPEATVNHITKRSPLSLPTVSQHLKILRITGLVIAREEYPFTYYRINRQIFIRAVRDIVHIWSRIAQDDELAPLDT